MAHQKEHTKQKQTKLLFAALIRVSTEKQDKQGESLRTQKDDNIRNVDLLGGKIVAWYGGQEHATPGYEKTEVNRLLTDIENESCPFNAIIVTDEDRWSRDNEQSKRGLKILRDNGIRFFVDAMEKDLFNPTDIFVLGLKAEVGEFLALQSNRKSLKNRIHKAKRGYPTVGQKPYGRTFDKKTGKWDIDKKKKDTIIEIAKRYLAGESMGKLAVKYGFHHSTLWAILTKHSGDKWTQNFNVDKLNIHAVVETTVPRLLLDRTIEEIHRKAEANKTYTHGQNKFQYLINRMVFCEPCLIAMNATTSTYDSKYQYYRHGRVKWMKNKECIHTKKFVKAGELEETVMRYLFDMFGNAAAVKKAIEAAIPNKDELLANQKRMECIEKELVKLDKEKQRLVKHIRLGTITDEDAEKDSSSINERIATLTSEQQRISDNITHIPNSDTITKVSKLIANKRYLNHNYDEMSYEEKRELCEMVFSGKRPNGHRMGVYVRWNSDGGYSFSIHGHLVREIGLLPLSARQRAAYYEEGGGYKQKELLRTNSRRQSATGQRCGLAG